MKTAKKLSEVMGVAPRKRRTVKKEMTNDDLRKYMNWKNMMKSIGVDINDIGKAVGLAIENRWISPGTGNLSTDAAIKRLRTNLKNHKINPR